jgi:Zn-finger nucleic acid-binding protein
MRSFKCNNCGTILKLLSNTDASSGPCPKCSVWIDLDGTKITWLDAQSEDNHPSPEIENQRHTTSQQSHHGIRADNGFDHTYNQKRDLLALFKMLISAAIVGGIILAVYFYMKRWLTY